MDDSYRPAFPPWFCWSLRCETGGGRLSGGWGAALSKVGGQISLSVCQLGEHRDRIMHSIETCKNKCTGFGLLWLENIVFTGYSPF